ncbi:MAG: hypothetical protein HQK62_03715 [Desulfamplus sp.]|nr:hypothetical protein [Desulfamplus sp.]
MMFILDTDHISLFQRNNPDVVSRIIKTPPDKLATTIITFEEQIRGRLDIVRKAVTRNYKDFKTIPLLEIEDWSTKSV